jgi:L-arabinose transport system ATP-binding protein
MGISDRIIVMCQGRVAADVARADFDERSILTAALPDKPPVPSNSGTAV